MIIYDPILTGSINVNGTPLTSIQSIDTVSGSVVDLTAASGSFSSRVTAAEGSVNSLNSASSSYLLNTTDTLDGDLTVTGRITAQEFHTEFVSASIIFKSGSTRFGDTYDDTHVFTGSLENIYSQNGVTGSFRARGGQVTLEGLDADLNFRLTSGSGASVGEIRFWVDSNQIGEINMDKRDGEMTIQTQTSDGGILFRPNNTSVLFLTGSSVGVGTTIPLNQFEVGGRTQPRIAIASTGTSGASQINFGDADNGAIGTLRYDHSDDSMRFTVNSSEYVRINSSGNVGIDTVSPVSKLEISQQLSGVQTIDYPVTITSRDDNNVINQLGGEGVGIKFRLAGNDVTDPGNSFVGAGIAAIRETSADGDSNTGLGLFISQNDETLDEAIRISNSGKVGIGTGTPSAKFEVWNGAIQAGTEQAVSATQTLLQRYNSGQYLGNISTGHSAGSMQFNWGVFPKTGVRDGFVSSHDNFSSYKNAFVIGDSGEFEWWTSTTQAQVTVGNDVAMTKHMVLTAGGSVGIGTTSPRAALEVDNNSAAGGDALIVTTGANNGAEYTGIRWDIGDGSFTYGAIRTYLESSGYGRLAFLAGDNAGNSLSEYMAVSSEGHTLFGTSDLPNGTSIYGSAFRADSNSRRSLRMATSSTGTQDLVEFYNPNGRVGIIQTSGTATSYVQSGSDISLKKNIEVWNDNILGKFAAIEPKKFHFNFQHDTEEKVNGYIAQNMTDKFPEAYPLGENGKYNYNPSGMVVYLTKAIQELKAENDSLKARIEALEG